VAHAAQVTPAYQQKVQVQVKGLSYWFILKLHFKFEFTESHNETKDQSP
jgi:hypothetical protein